MPFDGGEFSRASKPHPQIPALEAPSSPAVARLHRFFRKKFSLRRAGNPAKRPTVLILEQSRALIEAEEAWCQGAYRAPDGKRCAVGALRAVTRLAGWRGFHAKRRARALLLEVAWARRFRSVELMNDRSTHAQVLAAFDAAIARQ